MMQESPHFIWIYVAYVRALLCVLNLDAVQVEVDRISPCCLDWTYQPRLECIIQGKIKTGPMRHWDMLPEPAYDGYLL